MTTRGPRPRPSAAGAERGRILAGAVNTARDLCNTPAHAPHGAGATREVAQAIGAETGLDVEVFDETAARRSWAAAACSASTPAAPSRRGMIKLTYTPDAEAPAGISALVGKGIMYDAGGISLKPSDAMHAAMKLDMSGAGGDLRGDDRPCATSAAGRRSPAG